MSIKLFCSRSNKCYSTYLGRRVRHVLTVFLGFLEDKVHSLVMHVVYLVDRGHFLLNLFEKQNNLHL